MAKRPTYEELETKILELQKNHDQLQLLFERAHLADQSLDEKGDYLKTHCTSQDIADTKFKQMETMLRESEKRYRLIVDTIPHGVQELDTSGKIIFANTAYHKMLGYDEKTLIGRSMYEMLPDNSAHQELYDYVQILIDQKPLPQPWCGKTKKKNGDILDVQTDWDYKRNRRGDIVGFISIISDITERKQAEEALQKAHNELEQRVQKRTLELHKTYEQLLHAEKLSAAGGLAASIAHEFNNPLYGVMNVIKGIKRRAPLDEEDVELIDMAIDECERMKELVGNLRDLNRPTSNKVGPTDIHASIDNILLLNNHEFIAKRIKVTTNYAKNMPQIKAVSDQIKQVILNLLNNAISACDGGGAITINTRTINDKNCIIQIHDTGSGINPDHIDKIYDPFFTTKATEKGTGLGLSISYGIIKKHGGRIDVESDPDRSTTFTITLPIDGV